MSLKEYEAIIVIDPRLAEDKVEQIIAKIQKKIEAGQGAIDSVKKMGKRPINCTFSRYRQVKEGHYLLINFKGEPSAPRELNAFFKIQEELIRYVVSKATPLPVPEEAEGEAATKVELKDEVEVDPSLLEGPKEK